MIDSLLVKLSDIAEIEFADVVTGCDVVEGKLRLYIFDGSFLDVWFGRQLEGRYAYHWERRHVDDTIYRWDNAKHDVWKNVKTFPHHFHEGMDSIVRESLLPKVPEKGLRYVIEYVRDLVYKINQLPKT
jgi:hypothetical protein